MIKIQRQQFESHDLDIRQVENRSNSEYFSHQQFEQIQDQIFRRQAFTYMLDFDQLDDEYLQYCPIHQIEQQLEYNLTLLKVVSDIDKSIQKKQFERCLRLGLSTVDSNVTSQWKMMNKMNRQSNMDENKYQVNNLILDDIFEMDLLRLRKLKLVLSENSKNLLKTLCRMTLGRNDWIQNFMGKLQLRIKHNLRKDENNQFRQSFWEVRMQNHEEYINSIRVYILQRWGLVSLYNFLKDTIYKWICDQSLQIQKRQLNLLHQVVQQRQKVKQYDEMDLMNNRSNLCDQFTRQYSLAVIEAEEQEEYNESYKNEPWLQVQHQSRLVINPLLLQEAATIEHQNIDKLCCINFLYEFSRIQSSLFQSHPRLEPLIILHQDVDIYDNQNKSFENTFRFYQTQIKKAVSALLNNNGGFILVGFRKQGQFYIPSTPFKHSENSIITIRKLIEDSLSKEITLTKNQTSIPFKNFKLDFIPIFKKRISNDKTLQTTAYAKQGQYIWRIQVFPDYQTNPAVFPINNMFFDLDRNNETFIQLCDSSQQKDLIYKKLKAKLNNYGNSQKQKSFIFKHNQSKLITHFGNCSLIQPGSYAVNIKQANFLISNEKMEETFLEQNKKKNQKQIQKLQEQKIIEYKKQQTSNQQNGQQKQEFKQINLIVLQNKQVKTQFQNYLEERKIKFRIEKMESPNLKKLSKQTYIIYHHRKFDEINSHLSDFKKKLNIKKNVILISAQKSVYVEQVLDSKQLNAIKKLLMSEDPNWQEISFVEDLKERENKTYLKGENKMSGIYLYFILSERNLKPKIKNLPQHLQAFLIPLDDAIEQKRSKEEATGSRQINSRQSLHQTSKKGSKHNQKGFQNNQNFINSNNQGMESNATNEMIYWNMTNPYYMQWKNFFINLYNTYFQHTQDHSYALEEFWNQLVLNPDYWNSFWAYGFNNEELFRQLNLKAQSRH